jgi:hypothetical protein
MFTIKELEDRWNDYESACLLTIKQLLEECGGGMSYLSNDLKIPSIQKATIYDFCIDIYVKNNTVMIRYHSWDSKDHLDITTELKSMKEVNYIELIKFIKELKNGKTNLGKEA